MFMPHTYLSTPYILELFMSSLYIEGIFPKKFVFELLLKAIILELRPKRYYRIKAPRVQYT